MRIHTLDAELWLPRTPRELFPFFADAANLQRLTPASLHFEILTPQPIEMRVGTLIDYRLRLHHIPLRWRSEITVWDPPTQFVDTQVRGPYKLWEHTHRFTAKDGGTLASDHVRYAALGGPLIHRWFVKPNLNRIFAYRSAVLKSIFASGTAGVGRSSEGK
jgi:hypothetical protein